LVTGAAGFIGSNILETLLQLDQRVIALDNFSTGYEQNLAKSRKPSARPNGRKLALSKVISAICRPASGSARE